MKILQTDPGTGKPTILQVVKMIVSASYVVAIVTCTVNAIMSSAVVGNALILMAIWKNQLLRTTSYILLGGLAITDLFTGLIVLPFPVLVGLLA